MLNKFKAGYTIFVESYLGDCDDYTVEMITGLTRRQVLVTKKFLEHCQSSYPDTSFYKTNANKVDANKLFQLLSVEEVLEVAKAVYPDYNPDSLLPNQLASLAHDLTYDLMGIGNCHGAREFSEMRVLYLDKEQDLVQF